MYRLTVALMVALLSPLPAVDARADLLHAVDGVELHGTMELLLSGASTCNVRESDTAYERRKANHGALMDVWRVNAAVHNRTGRWLDRVVGTYTVDSTWPACSSWEHPEGLSLLQMVYHSGYIDMIQEVGRNVVAPGEVLTAETEYVIVLRGDPAPRFQSWSLIFDLGDGGESGSDPEADEAALGLDRTTRRQLQRGLQAAGFSPGPADGLFGPRTRAAIRSWQRSRSEQPTGYLTATAAAALRPGPREWFRERAPAGSASRRSAARPAGTAARTSRAELAFWQSIANSTSPSVFEAYLSQFPNGVFRALAQNRLAVLGRSAAAARASARAEPAPRTATPRRTEARRSREPVRTTVTVPFPRPATPRRTEAGRSREGGRPESRTTATAPAAEDGFALAIGRNPAGGGTRGTGPTRQAAIESCRQNNGTGCEVVTLFEHCAATSQDYTGWQVGPNGVTGWYSSPAYGWAIAPDRESARRAAMLDCRAKGGADCDDSGLVSCTSLGLQYGSIR